MKGSGIHLPEVSRPAGEGVAAWRCILIGGENLLVTVALGFLVLLPLLEIVLRSGFGTGLPGSNSYVQHFTLIVGMLGGTIAARQARLLSLSNLTTYLKGRALEVVRIIGNGVAAAVCLCLSRASATFIVTERIGGKTLEGGIPVWTIQLLLPIGFVVIALRLIWHASGSWKGRILALVVAGALLAFVAWAPVEPHRWVVPGLVLIFIATALGAPIFAAISGITLVFLWGAELPAAMIPLKHYSLVTNPTLPSVPLFALAGYFLAEGGASVRLVNVFNALVGPFRGGTAFVTALVCAFFTSFTGASGVTILALGGLLLPVLIQSRFSERNALGLLTGAGSLGLLFPPCIPLILYAITAGAVVSNLSVSEAEVARVSIEGMFLGGIGPGVLLVIMVAAWGFFISSPEKSTSRRFDLKEAWRAVWEAKWELSLPVVALTALFSGFATPVEAAALTAASAFVVETFIYRDLKFFKDTPRVMTECGLLVGGVLLILGVAMGLSNYLVFEQIPTRIVTWVTDSIESRWLFLLALNGFLVAVGCLLDIYSAIIVVAPLIIRLGIAYGIDPIHLGIIFLANLELGYLTPPIGMNLFLSSYRFNKSMPTVIRSVWPVFLVLLVGVLIITYVPALSTTLPSVLTPR